MSEDRGVSLPLAKIIVAGGRPVCSDRGIAYSKEFADAVGGQVRAHEGGGRRRVPPARASGGSDGPRRSGRRSISRAAFPEPFSTKPGWTDLDTS